MAENASSKENSHDKTEQPTARKQEKAREEGQLVQSKEIFNVALFGGLFSLLYVFGPYLGTYYKLLFGQWIYLLRLPDAQHLLGRSSLYPFLLKAFVPLFFFGVVLWSLIIILGTAQTGLFLSSKGLMPQWRRLSLIANAKKLFSLSHFVEVGKNFLKIGLILCIIWLLLGKEWQTLPVFFTTVPLEIFFKLYTWILRILGFALLTIIVLFLADYGYQWFQWLRQLRMTRHELKEEMKESQGDPYVKQAQKKHHRAMLNARLQHVPDATVVVTNPTHYAVALLWRPHDMDAPKVIAKGEDFWAQRIRDIAKSHDIPVVEEVALARLLYEKVVVDTPIHPDHYQAVATIMKYVMQLRPEKFRF